MDRPALDPELARLLAQLPAAPALDAESLLRQYKVAAETFLEGRSIERRELSLTAADGATLPLSVFRPAGGAAEAAPCIFWLHGGGMVMGDRFANLDIPLDWLERFGAVVVTLDYRLAPEAQGATAVEDCYSGLEWIAGHATELGIDPARLIVAGISAGGGLTAGMVLMARDRGGPAIAAQVLICPMLDHRNDSVSSRQYAEARPPGRAPPTPSPGRRCSAPPRRFRPMRRRRWRPISAGCRRASSIPARPNCSATKTRPSRAASGRRAAWPSCMSGPAAFTVLTRCSPRHGSHALPARRAAPGSAAS
jgi:hypothetical protein